MPLPPARRSKFQRPPSEGSADQQHERATGALLGLAVGDALGAPNKGRRPVVNNLPEVADFGHLEMRGGGPFKLKPGQVNWPTQMATSLGVTLRNLRHYDLETVSTAYLAWQKHAFDRPATTKRALDIVAQTKWPASSGRRAWLEDRQRATDHGALARCAPIAVLYVGDQRARIVASLDDAAMTHFAPVCQLACAVMNGLIAAAISTPTERLTPEAAKPKLESELRLAASLLAEREPEWIQLVLQAADDIRADVALAQADDPELYGPELHLFAQKEHVRVALRLVLWHFFRASSFETALGDIINRGGEADVNAAIAGALLGAVWGASAVPADWKEAVLEGPRGLRGPLAVDYHPQTLLTLVGTTVGTAENTTDP